RPIADLSHSHEEIAEPLGIDRYRQDVGRELHGEAVLTAIPSTGSGLLVSEGLHIDERELTHRREATALAYERVRVQLRLVHREELVLFVREPGRLVVRDEVRTVPTDEDGVGASLDLDTKALFDMVELRVVRRLAISTNGAQPGEPGWRCSVLVEPSVN